MACFSQNSVKNIMSLVLASENNCELLKNRKSQTMGEKRLHIRLSWSSVKRSSQQGSEKIPKAYLSVII